MKRIGPRSSPWATKCTRVPSLAASKVQVPSIGCGPSTMWVWTRRGRSNSVNSTTCSNSGPIGGLVRSRTRLPWRIGPSVSGSTDVFDVCHSARCAGSVR
jgi:hypothetical protein